MKNLDVSNPSFEDLILKGSLYVDKTSYIHELVTKGTYYFCSRPRRFGKTLTISTLESLFKGKRELFKGLAIDSLNYDWKTYPVLHIDFGKCQAKNPEEIEDWINFTLGRIASEYGLLIDKNEKYYQNMTALIEELSKTSKVVILVDEYDKILSSNIYNPCVEDMRNVIRGLFEVIKASYDSMRFVFITGVTKYAKVSVFSSMNNLNDISMDERYSCLFGYTQKELEDNFAEYIESGASKTGIGKEEYLKKLKDQYDGYRFAVRSETVYNPVSIGMFFSKGGTSFDNYWVDTGNMKLLMDLSKKVNFNVDSSLEEPLDITDLTSFDIIGMAKSNVGIPQLKSLLLQSGYLTITGSEDGYSLMTDYPNAEVRSSFASRLMNIYTGVDSDVSYSPERILLAFANGNTEKAIAVIKSIFASVPYNLEVTRSEADYHAMFHCMMKAVGADLNSEVATNKGRIDAVLKTPNHIYVIEFKKDKSSQVALDQIKEMEYQEQYRAWKNEMPQKKIHLLGINFSTEKRNIDEWKEEMV